MKEDWSRRRALRAMLMVGTAMAVFPAALRAREYGHGKGMPWQAGVAEFPYYGTRDDRFFTAHERAAVAAMAARLIPSDEDGPGAAEADVVTFIDRQMAGFYGSGQHWYMRAPWPEGLPTQGYQGEHPPAALYRLALAELETHCQAEFGAAFADLEEADQDAVLTGMDEETIIFEEVSAKQFFDLLLENTVEGFFADPIYGGNRDMVAWRYVGFPGARYDYRDFIHHDGRPIEIEPVSLLGRAAWRSSQ